MKKEFTFIWGQRFCLIVNYKCVCWGGGGGGGGGGWIPVTVNLQQL